MIPYYSDYINAATFRSLEPSCVHVQNTTLAAWFRRYLLQKAISVFRWTLPRYWNKTLFLYCLYCYGYIAVIETDAWGVLPQPCTLYGRGAQFEPTHAIIQNPMLEGLTEPRIGIDCSIIRLMPDYGGIMDTVNFYAREMALTVEAYELNTTNSKLSFIFGIPDGGNKKASAEALKKIYDQIMSGEPAAFADRRLVDLDGRPTWTLLNTDVGKNYIAPELQEALRRLECQFTAAVGIPSNLATTKKERVTTVEVDANNAETAVTAAMWLDQLKDCCEDVNKMFGLQLAVDWRYKPDV